MRKETDMAFFQSKPNLPDGDKAKTEFYFHTIAACLGPERLKLPVKTAAELLPQSLAEATIDEQLTRVGEYLHHDISGINLLTVPQPVEKCGSGGG